MVDNAQTIRADFFWEEESVENEKRRFKLNNIFLFKVRCNDDETPTNRQLPKIMISYVTDKKFVIRKVTSVTTNTGFDVIPMVNYWDKLMGLKQNKTKTFRLPEI